MKLPKRTRTINRHRATQGQQVLLSCSSPPYQKMALYLPDYDRHVAQVPESQTQTCHIDLFIWLGTRQTSTIDPLSHSTVHRRPHRVCPQCFFPTIVPSTNKHLFHEAH